MTNRPRSFYWRWGDAGRAGTGGKGPQATDTLCFFWCLTNWYCWQYDIRHSSHAYGLLTSWTRLWVAKLPICVNCRPQMSHANGVWPEWTPRTCVRRLPTCANDLRHTAHVYGFSPVCTRTWFTRLLTCRNRLQHIWHLRLSVAKCWAMNLLVGNIRAHLSHSKSSAHSKLLSLVTDLRRSGGCTGRCKSCCDSGCCALRMTKRSFDFHPRISGDSGHWWLVQDFFVGKDHDPLGYVLWPPFNNNKKNKII